MTYATQKDLVIHDEQRLWNVAMDRESGKLNETWIDQALRQADNEINSYLSRRYTLPLNPASELIKHTAITLAFYWLSDRDGQVTELMTTRYKMALTQLREIADGKRDLGLPDKVAPSESQRSVVVQENERLFTRSSLRGVL